MLDEDNIHTTLNTVKQLLIADGNYAEVVEFLRCAEISTSLANSWNNVDYFDLHFTLSVNDFVRYKTNLGKFKTIIVEQIETVISPYDFLGLGSLHISPLSASTLDWDSIADLFSKDELLKMVYTISTTMTSVATGEAQIQDLNDKYKSDYQNVSLALKKLKLENPNPYVDLWAWYQGWKANGLTSYQSRRNTISAMYSQLINKIMNAEVSHDDLMHITVNLDGWERIDRTTRAISKTLRSARTEEQYQQVGLLSRETIISIAQMIFDVDTHPSLDGVKISKTDSKRMLDAYIAVKLRGSSNENIRRYAKASIDLANELTHKRTANLKDASLCTTALLGLVNLIGTLEDRYQ